MFRKIRSCTRVVVGDATVPPRTFRLRNQRTNMKMLRFGSARRFHNRHCRGDEIGVEGKPPVDLVKLLNLCLVEPAPGPDPRRSRVLHKPYFLRNCGSCFARIGVRFRCWSTSLAACFVDPAPRPLSSMNVAMIGNLANGATYVD